MENVEEEPFSFRDEEGNVIPGDQLLAQNKDVLINIIRFRPDAQKMVRNLERAGPDGRRFVKMHQLWKILFNRDYPDVMQAVYDADAIENMREDVRIFLDGLSDNAGIRDTYWKRYYEYVYQMGRILAKPRDKLDKIINGVGTPFVLENSIRGAVGTARMYPTIMTDKNGRSFGWLVYMAIYSDRNNPKLIYILPEGDAPLSNRHPQQVLRVDFDRRDSMVAPIAFEDVLLGQRMFTTAGNTWSTWATPTKTSFYAYSRVADTIALYSPRPARFRLVSSKLCTECFSDTASMCADCNTLLCSAACWNTHTCLLK